MPLLAAGARAGVAGGCLDAGLTELELRRAALLRDPQREGGGLTSGPYILSRFDRDSVRESGCVGSVLVTSRYLSDVDGTGKSREKKTLHLPTADFTRPEYGNGLPKPCGFNLEARYHSASKLQGILIVEGPLDAIACTEREHPAIAMMKPRSPALAALLPADRARFFAPDGTKDVGQQERCSRAAVAGYYTMVCLLPKDKDPDDLDAAGLDEIKRDARPVLAEYLELAEMNAGPARKVVLDALGARLAEWSAAMPALSGEMRGQAMGAGVDGGGV